MIYGFYRQDFMKHIFPVSLSQFVKLKKDSEESKIKGKMDWSLAIKLLTAKSGGQGIKQLKRTHGCCIIDKKVNIFDSK